MSEKLDMGKFIDNLADSFDKELYAKSKPELEEYWYFKYDSKSTKEWNLYEFHKALKSYGSFCRQWEEKHNGCVCVVERVRGQYLMPKIKEFIINLEKDNGK